MSSLLPDLVKIQVLSSGTGPFQLGAAATGFRGIEALVDGGSYSYSVQSGAQYEVGTCVWNAGSGLLIRTPLLSSNGNAAVAFGANVEVKFVALGQDLTPPGALPIVQTTGTGTDVAMSQDATTLELGNRDVAIGLKANASALGVAGSAADMGTFTGSTIPDNSTGKQAIQALETAVELRPTSAFLAASTGAPSIGFQNVGTGAQLRDIQTWLREEAVHIQDFFQTGDPDWTLAANRAAATGKNVYMPERSGGYIVSDAINQHANGQQFFGDGVTKSYFRIQSGFNMSATGVMVIPSTASEKGAGCSDIGFFFEQPGGATVRANLIQYPYAIYAQNVTRLKFRGSVRLSGAWNGIDVRGNTGGFDANLLEIGAFNQGMYIDGAADFFHITSLNFWPYDYSSGAFLTIWQDGSTRGLKCGRCDSMDIKSITGFNTIHEFFKSGVNEPFGAIGILSLDGRYSQLLASGGRMLVGVVYGTSDIDEIKMDFSSTAQWSFGAHWFLPNTSGSLPFVRINGTNAIATFAPGITSSGSTSAPVFRCSSGSMILDTPTFDFGTNTTRSQPFIDVAGGRATVEKPRLKDIGTGSGNAIAVANDENHDIEVNALLGWGISLPSTITNGNYSFDRNLGATPTVAFATPGNSSFTYTTQATTYRVQGGICQFRAVLVFTTNAYTTASGAFILKPNIPFLPTYAQGVDISSMANVTFDASKSFAAELQTDGTILVRIITSAGALGNFGTANVLASTSGVQFSISGSFFV